MLASLVVLFFGLIYLGMGSGVFPAKFTEGKEGGPRGMTAGRAPRARRNDFQRMEHGVG